MSADSRAPWLQVVDEWPLASIGLTHQVTLGKMLADKQSEPTDVLRPYLRAAHIPPGGLDLSDPKLMWFSPTEAARLDLRRGDVVVVEGGMGGYGRCDIVPDDLTGWGFQNSINRVRARGDNDGRFTKYVLQLARWTGYIEVLCSVSTMPHLTAEKLAAMVIPNPPGELQSRIADFLDRETAEIDALIAKQEQLIATLQEDRIATITHAVTRGLDSEQTVAGGSVWVGERPRTWTDTKLKYLIASVESGTSVNGSDTSPSADELGVLKTSAVSTGRFVPGASKTVVGEEVERLSSPVRTGTLLVNRANSPQFVGSAAYVDHAPDNLYLSDKIWQFSFRGVDAEFVHFWTLTPGYRAQVESGIVGTSSSMQNVSMADYRELALAVPDLVEQRSIVNAVRARVGVIINLVNKSAETIATLREYRSALITDAVTGKIDVREMV